MMEFIDVIKSYHLSKKHEEQVVFFNINPDKNQIQSSIDLNKRLTYTNKFKGPKSLKENEKLSGEQAINYLLSSLIPIINNELKFIQNFFWEFNSKSSSNQISIASPQSEELE